MKIIFLRKRIEKPLKEEISRAVKLTLDELKQDDNLELNIEFITRGEMRELNNRMRGIDKETDVLSFPNFSLKPFEKIEASKDSAEFLGDMAICLDVAKVQAEEYGNTLENEIVKLVIHSTLHLMGFDHIKDEDYKVMHKLETKIMNKFLKN